MGPGLCPPGAATRSVERVLFRFSRMLPEYVWDAGVLEGNRFTFPEMKTVVEGVTVAGRKLSDQGQLLNLGESAKYLGDQGSAQHQVRLSVPMGVLGG